MQDIKWKKDGTVLRIMFFKLNFAGLDRDNGRRPTLVYVIRGNSGRPLLGASRQLGRTLITMAEYRALWDDLAQHYNPELNI